MTDDIVKRILRTRDEQMSRADEAVCEQAADEIERLRADLAAEREKTAHAERYACERDYYRAEWSKALNERNALRAQWREDVFRAFQEGFNSSLSYVGEDGMAEAWGMSDAKARIDAALNKGGGDE